MRQGAASGARGRREREEKEELGNARCFCRSPSLQPKLPRNVAWVQTIHVQVHLPSSTTHAAHASVIVLRHSATAAAPHARPPGARLKLHSCAGVVGPCAESQVRAPTLHIFCK